MISSSKELFINMKEKDIPVWNPSLSYFDQEISTIHFFEEEFKKITKGVNVGGFFIHPWLYWHINFFKTKITMPDLTEPVISPPLDDHAFYFAENYKKAEKEGKGLFLFGTRGFSKTVLESSIAHWKSIISSNGIIEAYGGTEADLKDLALAIKVSNQFVHSAFKLPILKEDWGGNGSVEFGVRERNGAFINYSTLNITTVGTKSTSSEEKGAGGTPACIIIDEAGKFDPISLLTSLQPKIWSQYGAKLVPILAGTGGTESLSRGAKKILENPKDFNMLEMDYSLLNKHTPKEYRTWEVSDKKPFCTFVPGQMSYRVKVEKKNSNISDYLGIKDNGLSKIKIRITDWEGATNFHKKNMEDFTTLEAKNKYRMYYPLNTDDCFLTDSYNPFDVFRLTNIKNRLLKEENFRKVELFQNGDGNVDFLLSDKELAKRHYENKDTPAPVVLFDDVDNETPKWKYVSGLDDYKMTTSKETLSLGSFYVLKRRGMDINTPIEKIVLSYSARPHSSHNDLYENIRLGGKMFNSILNMESIDSGYANYLETLGFSLSDYLIPNISPAGELLSKKKNNNNSRFGTYPTPANKKMLLDTVIQYTKEEVVTSFDENGEPVVMLGCDFITDPYLLEEMIDYKSGGNHDRIDAFGYALLLCRYLDKIGRVPEQSNRNVKKSRVGSLVGGDAILNKNKKDVRKTFVNFSNNRFVNF
jgi:hypothetical protein